MMPLDAVPQPRRSAGANALTVLLYAALERGAVLCCRSCSIERPSVTARLAAGAAFLPFSAIMGAGIALVWRTRRLASARRLAARSLGPGDGHGRRLRDRSAFRASDPAYWTRLSCPD